MGLVLGCFGYWELTRPGQWTGFVPRALAAIGPPVVLVLVHGWVLFVLGVAALIDVGAPLVPWIAVALMTEIVLGLALTSRLTSILVRDIGLLALALVWALDAGAPIRLDARATAAPGPLRERGRTTS
jgi:hypothetical protein